MLQGVIPIPTVARKVERRNIDGPSQTVRDEVTIQFVPVSPEHRSIVNLIVGVTPDPPSKPDHDDSDF